MATTIESLTSRAELQEKLRLRAAIRSGLDELEKAARKTSQLEAALAHFADEYFAALGEATDALAARETSAGEKATAAILPTLNRGQTKNIKATYRQLMKTLHPDAGGTAADTEALAEAQRAYEARDIASLLRLELELSPPPAASPTATLEGLEQKLLRIIEAIGQWENRYHALCATSLYACWQRATTARLAGRNWIQTITDRLKRELANEGSHRLPDFAFA